MNNEQRPAVMVGDFPDLDRVKRDLDECALAVTRHPDCQEFERIYVLAAVRRTLSLIVAFRQSITVGNEQMAATLLRLNLDTVARFYALFWAEETNGLSPELFARKVFEGEAIKNMKLRNQNQKASDRWLIDQIDGLGPWIKNVYKETSGAIHFSDFHMKRLMSQAKVKDGTEEGTSVWLVLAGTETDPGNYTILTQAFNHICQLLVCAMQDRCGLLERP